MRWRAERLPTGMRRSTAEVGQRWRSDEEDEQPMGIPIRTDRSNETLLVGRRTEDDREAEGVLRVRLADGPNAISPSRLKAPLGTAGPKHFSLVYLDYHT
ncbi:hypothetical protein BHE74_00029573 [Ensete ventricosum]|nr:hypothetical protein BHE74_00029573 [Ensete ventricosum]